MHLAVCCKGIPEEAGNFSFSTDGHHLSFDTASVILNESDEYALDEAIRWKKRIGAKVKKLTSCSWVFNPPTIWPAWSEASWPKAWAGPSFSPSLRLRS